MKCVNKGKSHNINFQELPEHIQEFIIDNGGMDGLHEYLRERIFLPSYIGRLISGNPAPKAVERARRACYKELLEMASRAGYNDKKDKVESNSSTDETNLRSQALCTNTSDEERSNIKQDDVFKEELGLTNTTYGDYLSNDTSLGLVSQVQCDIQSTIDTPCNTASTEKDESGEIYSKAMPTLIVYRGVLWDAIVKSGLFKASISTRDLTTRYLTTCVPPNKTNVLAFHGICTSEFVKRWVNVSEALRQSTMSTAV